MALIDQRILIDAPTEAVWQVISDPMKLPKWHTGYSAVSVLTTLPGGVGARWRCTVRGGKDVIEQITGWVEGLGYEYTQVEGGPYRNSHGRIRLQAGPDGTTVQWTFSYEPKGLLGAVKNRLSGRRRTVEMMATSLRQLRREVDALGTRMSDTERAKVSIRGRMNADERAQYQRRYAPPQGTPVTPGESVPVVPSPSDVDLIPPAAVPSFVVGLTHEGEEPDYSHKADTKPKAPPGLREAIAEGGSSEPGRPSEDALFARPAEEPPSVPESMRVTPARGIPMPPPDDPFPAVEAPRLPVESTDPTPPRGISASDLKPPDELTDTGSRANLPPPTPKTDTGEISIWEAFGVRRPSEQNQAVLDDFLQTVHSRRIAARRVEGRIPKRPVRVRRLKIVIGLRSRLSLEAARVRLRRAILLDEGEQS